MPTTVGVLVVLSPRFVTVAVNDVPAVKLLRPVRLAVKVLTNGPVFTEVTMPDTPLLNETTSLAVLLLKSVPVNVIAVAVTGRATVLAYTKAGVRRSSKCSSVSCVFFCRPTLSLGSGARMSERTRIVTQQFPAQILDPGFRESSSRT